jgi:two-component sensor histidine kinase
MIFSELIGNSLRHAGTRVRVALDLTHEHAVLHVLDDGPGFWLNPKLPAEPYSERGRGLYIVAELAREFTSSARTLTSGTHARAVLSGTLRRRLPQRALAAAN